MTSNVSRWWWLRPQFHDKQNLLEHVAAYIEALQATAAKPTVKEHLAAIRMLFDWLIIGQVLANFAIGRGHYHCKHEPCWYVVRKGSTADVVADRQKFEIGNRPRHAKAGRVHASADRE